MSKFTFSREEFNDFLKSGGHNLRPRLQRSLLLADTQPGMTILDIGCGKGEILVSMANQGIRCIGLDRSWNALTRYAKETRSVLSKDLRIWISLQTGNATSLPFRDQVFDRIFMLDIIEHLSPDKLELAVREARRCLKKDGYLVLHTVPNRWALKFGYPILWILNPGLPADPRTDAEKASHVNEQDIIKLGKLLRGAGMDFEIWLDNMTLIHAKIAQEKNYSYEDSRPQFYRVLSKWYLKPLIIFALHTPLKFIICNDIYGLAWHKDGQRPKILCRGLHTNWMERLMLTIV